MAVFKLSGPRGERIHPSTDWMRQFGRSERTAFSTQSSDKYMCHESEHTGELERLPGRGVRTIGTCADHDPRKWTNRRDIGGTRDRGDRIGVLGNRLEKHNPEIYKADLKK
jgi:hypothetical protein